MSLEGTMKSQSQHAPSSDRKPISNKIFCLYGSAEAAEDLPKSLRMHGAGLLPVNGSGALKLSEAGKSGATVLVLSEPPEYTLARSLHAGGDMEQTFKDWFLCMQSLRDVACVAPDRMRILLFTTDTQKVAAELARFEIVEPDGELLSFPALAKVDPLFLLAAEGMIARDANVMAVAQEITALAVIAPAQHRFFDLEDAQANTSSELIEVKAELNATLDQLLRVQESELKQTLIANELRSEITRRREQRSISVARLLSEQDELSSELTVASIKRKIPGETVRQTFAAFIFYRMASSKLFSQRRRERLLRSGCKRDPFLAIKLQEAKTSKIAEDTIAKLDAELAQTRKNLAKLEEESRKKGVGSKAIKEDPDELKREIKRLLAIQAGLERELNRAETQVLSLSKIFMLPLDTRG